MSIEIKETEKETIKKSCRDTNKPRSFFTIKGWGWRKFYVNFWSIEKNYFYLLQK